MFTVIFCPNKHVICIASEPATPFILPLSVRSFRLAKWEREGMDGRDGRAGEVEGREEERGRSRLGDPS